MKPLLELQSSSPPKTFRFWPPCFVRYQVCENRLKRYADLPDDQRIKPVEEKYPTTDSFELIAWKEQREGHSDPVEE